MSSLLQSGQRFEASASSNADPGQCDKGGNAPHNIASPAQLTHPRTWSEDRLRYWLRSSKIGRRYETSLLKGTDGKNVLRWPLTRFVGLCDGNKVHGQYLYNSICERIEKFEAQQRRVRAQHQAALSADRAVDPDKPCSPTHNQWPHAKLQQFHHHEHRPCIQEQKTRLASAARWVDYRSATLQNLAYRHRSSSSAISSGTPSSLSYNAVSATPKLSTASTSLRGRLDFRLPPRCTAASRSSASAETGLRERLSAWSHTLDLSPALTQFSASKAVRGRPATERHSELLRERQQQASAGESRNEVANMVLVGPATRSSSRSTVVSWTTVAEHKVGSRESACFTPGIVGSGEAVVEYKGESGESGSFAWVAAGSSEAMVGSKGSGSCGQRITDGGGQAMAEREGDSRRSSGNGSWATAGSRRATFMSAISWMQEDGGSFSGEHDVPENELDLSPVTQQTDALHNAERWRNDEDDRRSCGASFDREATSESRCNTADDTPVSHNALPTTPTVSVATTPVYHACPSIEARKQRADTRNAIARTPPTRIKPVGFPKFTPPRRSARSPVATELSWTKGPPQRHDGRSGPTTRPAANSKVNATMVPGSYRSSKSFSHSAANSDEDATKLFVLHRDALSRMMINARQLEEEQRTKEWEAEMHRPRVPVSTILSRSANKDKCTSREKAPDSTMDLQNAIPHAAEKTAGALVGVQKSAAPAVDKVNAQGSIGSERGGGRASGEVRGSDAVTKAGKACRRKLVVSGTKKPGVSKNTSGMSSSRDSGAQASANSRGPKTVKPLSSMAQQTHKISSPFVLGRTLTSPVSKQRAVALPSGGSARMPSAQAVPSLFPTRRVVQSVGPANSVSRVRVSFLKDTDAPDTAHPVDEVKDTAPRDAARRVVTTHESLREPDKEMDVNDVVHACAPHSSSAARAHMASTGGRLLASRVEGDHSTQARGAESGRDQPEGHIPPNAAGTVASTAAALPARDKVRSEQELAAVRLVQRQATQLLGLTADMSKLNTHTLAGRLSPPLRSRTHVHAAGADTQDARVLHSARTLGSRNTISNAVPSSNASKNALMSASFIPAVRGGSPGASPVVSLHEARERNAVALVNRQARDILGQSWSATEQKREMTGRGPQARRATARRVEDTIHELDALSAEVKHGIAIAAEKRKRGWPRQLSSSEGSFDIVPWLEDERF